MSTLFPANPIASNPIQLSMNPGSLGSALPAAAARGTAHPKMPPDSAKNSRRLRAPANVQPLVLDCRERAGGADRVRTDDLRLARAALSQLSYSPVVGSAGAPGRPKLVGLGRFELPTSRLSGVRSNQLSYRPRPGTAPIPWKPDRGKRPADRPGGEHPSTREGFGTRSLLERR